MLTFIDLIIKDKNQILAQHVKIMGCTKYGYVKTKQRNLKVFTETAVLLMPSGEFEMRKRD